MSSLVSQDDYAALERCTYFNQAALGLIPRSTVEVMHAFLDETAQFGNLYLSDQQEAAILDGVRSAGADVLGAPIDAIAVVGGASEGLGQVASILEPDVGTVVLVESDFPSVSYPWLAAAERRDITLRFVEDRPDQDLTLGLIDAIDPTTSAVVFSAVQYATGTRVAIERVTASAHDVGARVVVDVTQLAGASPVRMGEWQADAVVTSGYKWLSAHGGVALLALASDLRDRLPSSSVGRARRNRSTSTPGLSASPRRADVSSSRRCRMRLRSDSRRPSDSWAQRDLTESTSMPASSQRN